MQPGTTLDSSLTRCDLSLFQGKRVNVETTRNKAMVSAGRVWDTWVQEGNWGSVIPGSKRGAGYLESLGLGQN